LPHSAQSQNEKSSSSHYDENQANEEDDGGFETESPIKEAPPKDQESSN